MPVEHEFKFVLDPDSEEIFKTAADGIQTIRQGYLPQGNNYTVRIRRKEVINHITTHWFTYKNKIEGSVIEIEQQISQDDFDRLSLVASSWCHKVRYLVDGWDVDFFKENGQTYFCLAEIELPEGRPAPIELPHFISSNLIFPVPEYDKRFSSKKLSSPVHARRMLAKLLKAVG